MRKITNSPNTISGHFALNWKKVSPYNSKQKFLFYWLFFFKHPFQVPAKRFFMDSNPLRYDIIRCFFIPHPENIIQHFLKTDPLLCFSTRLALFFLSISYVHENATALWWILHQTGYDCQSIIMFNRHLCGWITLVFPCSCEYIH